MPCNFKPGDLVYFDFLHTIGVVVETRELTEFTYEEFDTDDKLYDVLVYWADGEAFWCLEFTLEHVL